MCETHSGTVTIEAIEGTLGVFLLDLSFRAFLIYCRGFVISNGPFIYYIIQLGV